MSTCESCLTLEGKPVTTEPHDGLMRGPTLRQADGELERYRCRKCGSLLQRFLADAQSGVPPQVWTRM